jgi:SAM-dependent methyltransferase
MDLSVRADLPELMDAADLDPIIYDRCLRDLAAVNRVTFTHRATLRWLSNAVESSPSGQEISVLDVAYGQGDLLRAIGTWAAKRGQKIRLSGIDLNPRSAAAARAATRGSRTSVITQAMFLIIRRLSRLISLSARNSRIICRMRMWCVCSAGWMRMLNVAG